MRRAVKIYKKSFLAQFAKDLEAVKNLDELRWVFDNKYGINLKNDITDVLTSPLGIAKIKELVKDEKIIMLFKVLKASDLDESVMSNFLSKNFNNIFSTQ